jgi:hypothetical protein
MHLMVYIYDFTLFKFLKDVSILTLHTLIDAPILNLDISFKMNSIHFMDIICS